MVFTWSFDETVAPVSGPSTTTSGTSVRTQAIYSFASFDVTIGGLTLDLAPDAQDDLRVDDGITNSSDYFQLAQRASNAAGPNGTTLLSWFLSSNAPDGMALSGTAHPTTAEFLAMDQKLGRINIFRQDGVFASLISRNGTITETTTVVPLPAGLPLLVGGVALLAVWGRRRGPA